MKNYVSKLEDKTQVIENTKGTKKKKIIRGKQEIVKGRESKK